MSKCMKSIIIILALSFQFSLFAESFKPIDVIVVWGKELDKEKRELYKKLKVKSVTSIQKNFALDIDSPNRMFTTYSFFDENGNETSFEHENEFDSKFDYEEEYVTDSLGNILEAYRDGRLIARQTFDKNGNMLSKKLYDSNGSVSWAWSYEYDIEGNPTLGLQYIGDQISDTLGSYKYEYVKFGEMLMMKSKLSLIDKSEILYSYDSLGREISYKEFDENGDLSYLVSKDYNSLTGYRLMLRFDGSIYISDTLQINEDGEPILRLQYDGNGKYQEKWTYEYYNDKLILLTIYDKNGIIKTEDKYDFDGKPISVKSFDNNSVVYSTSCEYHKNQLPKSEIHFNYKNNENRSIEYEYDYYE